MSFLKYKSQNSYGYNFFLKAMWTYVVFKYLNKRFMQLFFWKLLSIYCISVQYISKNLGQVVLYNYSITVLNVYVK